MKEIVYIEEILKNKINKSKIAVIQDNKKLSYQELDQYSANLSTVLLNSEIKTNDRVLIYLDKSIEFIISIFGILKAGGTYVPLDYYMPLDRLEYINTSCNPSFIITDTQGLTKLQPIIPIIQSKLIKIFVIDSNEKYIDFKNEKINSLNWEIDTVHNWDKKIINRSCDDIAYIIYTSGSTGKPKGVMIRHESIVAFIKTVMGLMDYSETTRFLNVCPLYFDGSLVDLYCTLMAGGTIVLMKKFVWSNEIIIALDKYMITDTLMPSSVLKLLVSRFSNLHKYKLPDLKTIWYGAESCPVDTIRKVKQFLPQVKFIHGYGPTEATHSTTLYFFDTVPDNIKGYLPIGKPLPTIKAYALNEKNEVIKPGETGELYIGGIQLMQGYCNDEERTNKVLVEDVFNKNEKVYKSGDYVTIDIEGNYSFIGRKDDMVKSSGNLIYLSEIENIILTCDHIKDVIALPYEDELFNTVIKVYIVLKDDVIITKSEIIQEIKNKLPSYMFPKEIYFIDDNDIPQNTSGKIDRLALKNLKSE